MSKPVWSSWCRTLDDRSCLALSHPPYRKSLISGESSHCTYTPDWGTDNGEAEDLPLWPPDMVAARKNLQTSGAHQITICIGLPHQLLGNNIHHRISIGNNGIQLLSRRSSTILGSTSPYISPGFLEAHILFCLVRILNNRRIFIRMDRVTFSLSYPQSSLYL